MIVLLTLFSLLLPDAHDIHLSNTVIHYKSDQKALQLTIHMFIDDLENAIQLETEEPLKLFTDRELLESDSLLLAYIDKNLKINLGKKEYVWDYIGKELSEDLGAVWTYIEIPNVSYLPESISIENTLLFDLFDDQRNLMNFKVDNKRKAFYTFDQKDTFYEFDL